MAVTAIACCHPHSDSPRAFASLYNRLQPVSATDELDYTTFGELSVVIIFNWDIFGGLFNSKKAVEKVMASLNALRNPIAHCSPLAEDEQLRLQLTVRDWFRLME